MYSTLKRAANAIATDVVEFTQELIRTPSPSYGEKNVASLVEDKMRAYGYDQIERDEFGNVIGILHGREDAPTLVLNSHMDTVPADCSGKWDDDPYAATIRDGKLIGLGASDCKGGVAAQVAAGAILKNALLPLRGNLVVTASVAEENGASVGVRGLLEKTLPSMQLQPKLVLLGEPTSLGLYYGHDGWAEIEVTLEGQQSERLQSAAWAVYETLNTERQQYSRAEAAEEMLVETPIFEEAASGGNAILRINRRLTAPLDDARLVNDIRRSAVLSAQSMGDVEVRASVAEKTTTLYTGRQTMVRRVTHAWETNPFDPMLERARQCLSAAGCGARPGKWQLGRLGMGTAGAVITREFGLPALGYGPGDENCAHMPGEYVDTNMLVEAAYGTAAIAHGLVGIPVMGWTSDEI